MIIGNCAKYSHETIAEGNRNRYFTTKDSHDTIAEGKRNRYFTTLT